MIRFVIFASLILFFIFQLSASGQGEEPVGYLNMAFSAPPPSSPLTSRGVEDMSHQRPTCHNPSMRREQDRLDSFHSWTLTIITAAELAKAGFYSLGQADRVACFSCGGHVCIVVTLAQSVDRFIWAVIGCKFLPVHMTVLYAYICSWITGNQVTELCLNTKDIIQTVVLFGVKELRTCRCPELQLEQEPPRCLQ